MDVYAELVSYLKAFPALRAVYEEMPHNAIPKHLPLAHLESAGPARRAPSWQGLGADLVGIDVNLYVPEAAWVSGAGMRLALDVRSYLHAFRCGPARAVEVSRPEKWPDRNPKSRRVGMTVEVLLPV